jgi:hypothetical protein
VKLDIARLIYAVDVAEGRSDREIGGDSRQSLVNLPDLLGLRVEGRTIDVLVVDAIFLTASNAYPSKSAC